MMGCFTGSFQFPKRKDFLASWACCFVCAASALCVEWTFYCHHPRHLSVLHPGTLLKSCHVSQWTGNCPQKDVCTLMCSHHSYFPFSIISSKMLVFKKNYHEGQPYLLKFYLIRTLNSECLLKLLWKSDDGIVSCLFPAKFHVSLLSFHFSATCWLGWKKWCRQLQNINLILVPY